MSSTSPSGWPRRDRSRPPEGHVGLIDEPACGDWLLLHVGFAIARVDEAEAHATLALPQEMGAEYIR